MSLLTLRHKLWRFVPALFLGTLLWFLWKGLVVEHPQTNHEMAFPAFSLGDVRTGHQPRSLADLKGQISIVHIWASWCGICVKEHEEWLRIKEKWPHSLVGIVYRDESDKVLNILAKKGDPYNYLLDDMSGSLGLDLGITGTPETFIVDKEGVIRFHHMGPVTQKTFEATFLPIIAKLNKDNA